MWWSYSAAHKPHLLGLKAEEQLRRLGNGWAEGSRREKDVKKDLQVASFCDCVNVSPKSRE